MNVFLAVILAGVVVALPVVGKYEYDGGYSGGYHDAFQHDHEFGVSAPSPSPRRSCIQAIADDWKLVHDTVPSAKRADVARESIANDYDCDQVSRLLAIDLASDSQQARKPRHDGDVEAVTGVMPLPRKGCWISENQYGWQELCDQR